MKVVTITTCHARAEVLKCGLNRYYETATLPTEHYILNHHYPIDYWGTVRAIVDICERHRCKLVSNPKNIGGHEGFNWVFNQLEIADDDIVIGYDPDTYPMHKGWDAAMVGAIQKEKSLGCVSLLIDHLEGNRKWETVLESPKVVVPDNLDMFNATGWRGSLVKKTGGMKALTGLYGGVELSMHALTKADGLKMGYLWDYRETFCPEAHDPIYNKWKQDYIHGRAGNFDEYIRTGPHQ
jgi:hypothetical protein